MSAPVWTVVIPTFNRAYCVERTIDSVLSQTHQNVEAIVVDDVIAYTGSENLTFTSLNRNREIGVFVTEADGVATMTATFNKDWSTGAAFP